MPSAALPPDLHAVAREAARDGGRPAPPRTARILGLGSYVPAEVIPNGPIAERMGVDDEWIVKRTGIHARRRVAPTERLSDIATFAGRRALQDAGVEPLDVDLVLVATSTADEIFPNAAPVVAQALGTEGAGAMDICAACTGFLSALSLAAAQVETGRAQRVLVIGAEALTRITDFDDKKTGALFGDAAGAVVVGADGEGEIGHIDLASDGGLADTIVATHEDPYIRMDGVSTFKVAVQRLSESTVATLAREGLALEDVDLFVYHQANSRIIRAIGERLDLEPAKVADYIGQYGNTSAASIPLTLSLLREDGRLRAGHRVLLGAIGAGFVWGTGLMTWGRS
jgi:3-oxoacyl-[acyl-carrier-protein] synthase-3